MSNLRLLLVRAETPERVRPETLAPKTALSDLPE